jgi:hypothetical protein
MSIQTESGLVLADAGIRPSEGSGRNLFSAGRGSGSTEGFLLKNGVTRPARCIICDVCTSRFPNVYAVGFDVRKAPHKVIDGNQFGATSFADDHDSIPRLKKWLLYLALIGNRKLSLALCLLWTVGGMLDDGEFSGDDRDRSPYGPCLNDAATQLSFCRLNLIRGHPPTSEIKIMVDSVQDIRRKDLIGAATAYKTQQKSLEKEFHLRLLNAHTSLKWGRLSSRRMESMNVTRDLVICCVVCRFLVAAWCVVAVKTNKKMLPLDSQTEIYIFEKVEKINGIIA